MKPHPTMDIQTIPSIYTPENQQKTLKVAMCQMEVKAGHPRMNGERIVAEIRAAAERADEVIVFPEMALPGYLVGDDWENDAFIREIEYWNEKIKEATACGMVAIWGSVKADFDKKGEDGRTRKYNAAMIAQNGNWVSNGVFEGFTPKTLLPKYREFDDARHFHSTEKLALEERRQPEEYMEPFEVTVKGVRHKLGLTLCEDMWSDDYALDPIKTNIEKGAEVMINLSCSPWTLGKNDKRHRVVKERIQGTGVPFVYINNVGVQNNNKNLFTFDQSTVYNGNGEVIGETDRYAEQVMRVELGRNKVHEVLNTEPENPRQKAERESKEIYDTLVYAVRKFFEAIPPEFRKGVIGLSGGVDSAVVACILADAIGSENVYAVNMPSRYNSDTTKDAAFELSKNLGCHYASISIEDSFELTLAQLETARFERMNQGSQKPEPVKDPVAAAKANRAAGIQPQFDITGITKENIQARDRGSRILAAVAAQIGGLFTCNGNKTESAFGFCTNLGDVPGAIAPINDLYKELGVASVYNMAKYINKIHPGRVPQEIINLPPSAELSEDHNVDEGKGDPFYYDYHDAMARFYIEWRKDPEDILQAYKEGRLDESMGLEEGTVAKYFSDAASLIRDLEKRWWEFRSDKNIDKQNQGPMNIVISRRAFGYDLRRSKLGVYFTTRYHELKNELLGLKNDTDRAA